MKALSNGRFKLKSVKICEPLCMQSLTDYTDEHRLNPLIEICVIRDLIRVIRA